MQMSFETSVLHYTKFAILHFAFKSHKLHPAFGVEISCFMIRQISPHNVHERNARIYKNALTAIVLFWHLIHHFIAHHISV